MKKLVPGRITLAELRALWNGVPFALDPAAWPGVEASAAAVAAILAKGERVYGINTGFGMLAGTAIAPDRLLELQRNLILSHCCGLGAPIEPRVVRLAVALKVMGLARGFSGVSPALVERLILFLHANAVPLIPIQGSVGASGDLAPLAHLAATLIGEGELLLKGEKMNSGEAHRRLGLDPLVLGPKEGLALINGTQISTALALDALFVAEHVFGAAILAGAMSLEALKGSRRAFDPRIHSARGHKGQIAVAAAIYGLLEGSGIMLSHATCDRVQDPYSFRCQPQVMGACLDLMRGVAATLTTEADAVTDNPLILDDEAVSGGNFHAEPVAFAADMLAMALCEIGSISERRTAILMDPKMSGLPPFLVADSGVNSGLMIAQVSAAALVSENKSLAFPASVDSIPTSASQEDHVSMATHGAARTRRIADNAAGVIGIELIAAAQGVELHSPLKTGPILARAHAEIRRHVSFLAADRLLAPDIGWAKAAVLEGVLVPDAARDLLESDQPGTV